MATESSPQPIGKVSVPCPHCGSKQLESIFAKSTQCRKCGQHFDIGKLGALKLPGERNALFKKFGALISGQKTKDIVCFQCRAGQTVSVHATSSICPKCSTYIDLRDFKIATTFTRTVHTQGKIVITSKGEATSSKLACGAAEIRGKVQGNLFCTGTTSVKLKGRLLGGIETKELVVEKGSDVEFVRPVKVKNATINGKVSARINADGGVSIGRTGCLDGTIYAKSITVEKGGIFHGELFIGQMKLSQPDLLSEKNAQPLFGGTDQLAFGA